MYKKCFLTTDAGGAVAGARMGSVVVIVDVIDMSTTMEGALEAGAAAVYGAAPDGVKAPVLLNPARIGAEAGKKAVKLGAKVIIITEPRVGGEDERIKNVRSVISGLEKAGARVEAVLPNLGAETVKLVDMCESVVIAATGTGGVAYDAAFNAGAPAVLTATVARTLGKRGEASAEAGAQRAIEKADSLKADICVVAASARSQEDLLAAWYIFNKIISAGFTRQV